MPAIDPCHSLASFPPNTLYTLTSRSLDRDSPMTNKAYEYTIRMKSNGKTHKQYDGLVGKEDRL